MKIIGCDFHTRYQQIAMMDEATGELSLNNAAAVIEGAPSFLRCLQKGWGLDSSPCHP